MRELFSNVHCVLFDFDGPICSLFADRPAASVAGRLRELAVELGVPAIAPLASADPHAILLGVAAHQPASAVVNRLEEALTQEEIAAAATARPTPHADELITALSARDRRIAVVTNNSPLAVERYLADHQLTGCVSGRVHGRTRDISLLKPHPHALLRALATTRTQAARALMIGDTQADLIAARAAGVRFLGYGRSDADTVALRASGATHITRSLEHILSTLVARDPR